MAQLAGKVALITGASRGIGKAAAQELAAAGCAVTLLSRSDTRITEATEQIRMLDRQALGIAGDVSRFEDISATVRRTLDQFGRLDILVNNAGVITPIDRIETVDPVAWARALDINVKGVFFGMRAVLPLFREQGAGTIINISSGAANSALEGWSHYCSSKSAVKKLTECAHKENDGTGIHIIGLSPGTVATDMMETIRQSGINPVSRLDPNSHIPAEWAARAIVYLCGPNGEKHSGTDFSIKTEEGRQAVGLTMDGAPD